ncbi:MAG: DUF6491 family protein [Pseudomonadales bacterium]
MKRLSLLMAAVIAAGCAGKPAEPPAQTFEEVLSSTLTEDDYGKSARCIAMTDYDAIRVLDSKHLLFEGLGNRNWLNTLRMDCPGLRKNATLRIDARSSRLCNLDSVTGVEVRRFWMDRISATCSLGNFVPVTDEQAKFMKAEAKRR